MSADSALHTEEPAGDFTLNEVGRLVYDISARLATDEKKIQANRFAHETFERQQMALNKSVEDHMSRLLRTVEDLGKKPPEGAPTVTASIPRGWSLPLSVLVKPIGFNADTWPKLKIEPPRFCGEGVNLWIKKVQKYYNHDFTSLADRLYLTEFLMDDAAAEWFGFWEANNEGRGWEDFLMDIKRRFDPDLYEDYVGRLAALRQTGSLDDYLAEFEPLIRKVSNVGDATLTSLFIAGLTPSLKHELLTRRPSSLCDAIALAQQLAACRAVSNAPAAAGSRPQCHGNRRLHHRRADPRCRRVRSRQHHPHDSNARDPRMTTLWCASHPQNALSGRPGICAGIVPKNIPGSMCVQRNSMSSLVMMVRARRKRYWIPSLLRTTG